MISSMPNRVRIAAFSDEIEKIAARKALRLARAAAGGAARKKADNKARRLVRRQGRKIQKKLTGSAAMEQGGTKFMKKRVQDVPMTPAQMDEASRIGNLPGAVKNHPMGSEMWDVGRGSEGLATQVLKPTTVPGRPSVQLRKAYDPEGLTSAEAHRRKDVVGRRIGKNPNVAEYYGQAKTQGGGLAQFNEMVPQTPMPKPKALEAAAAAGDPKAQALLTKDRGLQATAKTEATRASTSAGFSDPQDIRPANMVLDARTGQYKVVDMIPAKPGEFHAKPKGSPENAIIPTATGQANVFNPLNGMKARTSTPALKQQLFRRPAQPTPGAPVLPSGIRGRAPAGKPNAMPTNVMRPSQQSQARGAAGSLQGVGSQAGVPTGVLRSSQIPKPKPNRLRKAVLPTPSSSAGTRVM